MNMLVFRTAVAYGLKKGKVRPKMRDSRSVCDGCGRKLSWQENIPVLSYLVMRGRSWCCATPLPRQYPIVEALAGVAFGATFLVGGREPVVLGLLLAGVSLLMFEAVFDANYMILPDWATAGLAVVVVVLTTVEGKNVADSLGGALIGLGVIGGIYLVTRSQGMGLGDVKLMPVLGWWLGVELTVVALYLAFIVGATIGVMLLVAKKVNRKQPIPFGPFLILGAWVAWWGAEWWKELVGKWLNF